jgi:hypothetical protein
MDADVPPEAREDHRASGVLNDLGVLLVAHDE